MCISYKIKIEKYLIRELLRNIILRGVSAL